MKVTRTSMRIRLTWMSFSVRKTQKSLTSLRAAYEDQPLEVTVCTSSRGSEIHSIAKMDERLTLAYLLRRSHHNIPKKKS